MAMAKKKAQERQLKEAAVEERCADRESKKRREVTDAIKRSKALLLEISSQGPFRLSTMVLKDLKALLMHAHPNGNADSKGTKAQLQGRIALLLDVVQALEAFSSTVGLSLIHLLTCRRCPRRCRHHRLLRRPKQPMCHVRCLRHCWPLIFTLAISLHIPM